MNDLLAALLLGIIEGITEFLPISSTGHLLIAERWLGHRSDLFNISIQAGAILAVVLIYRERLLALARGFGEPRKRDYTLKLLLAFAVTGALGIVVKKLGFALPESIAPVAWALLLGGFVILGVEAIDARRPDLPDDDPDAIGWGTAVLVGLAQVLAGVFPGTSRSAAAIFAALLFGKSSRLAATEFAFLVGIPTMFAATGYELLGMLRDGSAANEDWTALAVAFVASAITAFIAVKWLLRYIQTHRFTVFAWYRIALGAALLAWLSLSTATATMAAGVPSPVASVAFAAGPTAPPVTPGRQHDERDVPPPSGSDASRLVATSRERFDHLRLCSRAASLRKFKAEDLSLEADLASDYPGVVAAARRRLAWRREMAAWIPAVLDQASRECANEDFSPEALAEAALQAADLGDFAAAECYFTLAPRSLPNHSMRGGRTAAEMAANADYVVNARRLIARGLEAGDWRMVSQAAMAASGFDWSGIDDRSDPTLGYRMHRLMQRGLKDATHRDAMGQAADFEQKQLSVAQLRAADGWVDEHYRREFANKPLMHYGAMCAYPGEPAFPPD